MRVLPMSQGFGTTKAPGGSCRVLKAAAFACWLIIGLLLDARLAQTLQQMLEPLGVTVGLLPRIDQHRPGGHLLVVAGHLLPRLVEPVQLRQAGGHVHHLPDRRIDEVPAELDHGFGVVAARRTAPCHRPRHTSPDGWG